MRWCFNIFLSRYERHINTLKTQNKFQQTADKFFLNNNIIQTSALLELELDMFLILFRIDILDIIYCSVELIVDDAWFCTDSACCFMLYLCVTDLRYLPRLKYIVLMQNMILFYSSTCCLIISRETLTTTTQTYNRVKWYYRIG